jgi:hypothetical protein
MKSSANATDFVRALNVRFKKELYIMFQKPGPQQDPCGYPLIISLSNRMLLVDKIAVRWLK